MGRPSLYTHELAEHICELIAVGTPVDAFSEMDDVPSPSTVYKWLAEIDGFSEMYARARERYADQIAHEVITISDDADPTTMKGIEHARTRMDARKWAAAKFAPKKYGDRIKQEISGPNEGPIEVSDARNRLRDLLTRKRAATSG